MIELFIALFAAALVFSIFAFITIEQDLRDKSTRPVFVLAITMITWFFSVLAFAVPYSTTTSYAAYNVTTYNSIVQDSANVMNIQVYAKHNVTLSSPSPFPASAFYIYAPFALGMTTLFGFLTFLYWVNRGKLLFEQSLEED